MFFGFSNQPKRRGPPVVKKKMQPMSFGMGFSSNFGNPGKTKRKKNSMNKGDWDRDGVTNMFDCRPLNFRQQDFKRNQESFNKKIKARYGTKQKPKNASWLLSTGEIVSLPRDKDSVLQRHSDTDSEVFQVKDNVRPRYSSGGEYPDKGEGWIMHGEDPYKSAIQGAGAVRINEGFTARSVEMTTKRKLTPEQIETLQRLEDEDEADEEKIRVMSGPDTGNIYYDINSKKWMSK